MTKHLIHDHHLRSFREPDEALRYAIELRAVILSANWLIVGAALLEQGASLLSFSIEAEDPNSHPFLSGIQALHETEEADSLEDKNLDLLTVAIVKKDAEILVGASPLDWPLNTRLTMIAQDHLDLYYPNWNDAGAGDGTLVVDTDGSVSLASFAQ